MDRHLVIIIFAVISSMSTAGALFGLASKWIPDDWVYIFVTISIFIFFGFALAFFVQGKLVEVGAIKSSLLLSLILSMTYPMNSQSLRQLETKRLFLEIDSKYEYYKSQYAKNNPQSLDALEKKKNALEREKNELAIKYDAIKCRYCGSMITKEPVSPVRILKIFNSLFVGIRFYLKSIYGKGIASLSKL